MRGGSGRISSLDKANRSYVTIYVSAPLFCKKRGAPVYLLISYLLQSCYTVLNIRVGPDTKTAVETGSTKLKKVELPKIQRKHTNTWGARAVCVGPAMRGQRRRHAARVLLREPVSE